MSKIDIKTLRKISLALYPQEVVDYVFGGMDGLEDLPYVKIDALHDRCAFTDEELSDDEHWARLELIEDLLQVMENGIDAMLEDARRCNGSGE